MKISREWNLIQELFEEIDELTPTQQDMVHNWIKYLDPFEPFLEQQSENQLKWLLWMHEKYVNGNEEEADKIYD